MSLIFTHLKKAILAFEKAAVQYSSNWGAGVKVKDIWLKCTWTTWNGCHNSLLNYKFVLAAV